MFGRAFGGVVDNEQFHESIFHVWFSVTEPRGCLFRQRNLGYRNYANSNPAFKSSKYGHIISICCLGAVLVSPVITVWPRLYTEQIYGRQFSV